MVASDPDPVMISWILQIQLLRQKEDEFSSYLQNVSISFHITGQKSLSINFNSGRWFDSSVWGWGGVSTCVCLVYVFEPELYPPVLAISSDLSFNPLCERTC